jgi:uncharacterized protein DUF6932
MPRPKEDYPPLLPQGEHLYTLPSIRSMCVDAFSLSTTRAEIMRGVERIYDDLIRLKIPCEIVFDGSFMTKEIDPDDADFTIIVTPEFYESCSKEQRTYLDWIGDDQTIKDTHLCDCYLCVEYPSSSPEYYDGYQSREHWVNLYARSTIYRRVRGVAIIHVA